MAAGMESPALSPTPLRIDRRLSYSTILTLLRKVVGTAGLGTSRSLRDRLRLRSQARPFATPFPLPHGNIPRGTQAAIAIQLCLRHDVSHF